MTKALLTVFDMLTVRRVFLHSAPIIVEEETVTIIYDSKYTEDMEE